MSAQQQIQDFKLRLKAEFNAAIKAVRDKYEIKLKMKDNELKMKNDELTACKTELAIYKTELEKGLDMNGVNEQKVELKEVAQSQECKTVNLPSPSPVGFEYESDIESDHDDSDYESEYITD